MSTTSSNDQFLNKLTEIVKANLTNEQFGVSELAHEMGMNRVVLYRKVKLYTKKSVSKFISEIRLKRAFQLLQQHSGNVSEVAYKVGFGSPSYFIKCFNELYGFSPGELLNGDNPEDLNLADSEKTKKDKPTRKLKISLAVILLIIVATIISFSIYQNSTKNKLEKSIAVLPFTDDSPEKGYTYIISGLRQEIMTNLGSIEDIRLVSLQTSEQYRDSKETITEIGKEINANYFLEGNAQTINGKTRIRLSLIETATDKHLWTKPYEREITLDNFFEIQKEIAEKVVDELNAIFTPEEKEQIARIPTKNKAAYNLYLRGLHRQELYELDRKEENYIEAKLLYEKAIELDSAFADAYCQLADIYISNLAIEHFSDTYSKKFYLFNLYLDSGLVLINKAINFENCEIDKVLQLKVDYHQRKGEHNEALKYFEQLWENKKKDYNYYLSKSEFYSKNDDYYNTIENTLLYLKPKPETKLADQYRLTELARYLSRTGFPKMAKTYAKELYKLHNDSIKYLYLLAYIDYYNGDFNTAIEKFLILHSLDTTNLSYIGVIYVTFFYLNKFPEAFEYAQLHDNMQERLTGKKLPSAKKGYLYLINGKKEEAMWNFNRALDICIEQIEINVPYSQHRWTYGKISGIYAMQGDKENAIENLKIMASRISIPHYLIYGLKVSPYWFNLHEEPEFKKIKKEMEAKYQKEHDKVEKLLIREGIIE